MDAPEDGKIVVNRETPLSAALPAPDIRGALKEEWAECRAAIGRFDALLLDVRKFGFALVTTLLAASTLFGLLSTKDAKIIGETVLVAYLVILALNAILFTLDTSYAGLRNGAVERALDLEEQLKSHRITKYLSDNGKSVSSVSVTVLLYLSLHVLIIVLALWTIFFGLATPTPSVRPVISWVVYLSSVLSLLWMILYWGYVDAQTHLVHEKPGRRWDVAGPGQHVRVIGRRYNAKGQEKIEWLPPEKDHGPKAHARRAIMTRLSDVDQATWLGTWVHELNCVKQYGQGPQPPATPAAPTTPESPENTEAFPAPQ
jgi:hypothetical protein